jgi:hypothetical protein
MMNLSQENDIITNFWKLIAANTISAMYLSIAWHTVTNERTATAHVSLWYL